MMKVDANGLNILNFSFQFFIYLSLFFYFFHIFLIILEDLEKLFTSIFLNLLERFLDFRFLQHIIIIEILFINIKYL